MYWVKSVEGRGTSHGSVLTQKDIFVRTLLREYIKNWEFSWEEGIRNEEDKGPWRTSLR